ncbi:ROK family protein [Frigoribacterium sp. PhB24]|uniref:ROK family protein n=1 Tax=Frigoribacterium sp. PhB24 TaxID=2485204 RepID=UPI000F48DEB6|nr:ROK family protein [Frigoribacterium sp. PhB24]ROS50518.1 putative NBD/HSP70 family sugar kinase [Frigoribacterium sp. PhB24]
MRVGLDIGGTKIDAVVVDGSGAPVHRLRLPTGFGPDAVLANATTAVTSLAGRVGVDVVAFESVGVGIPGLVDGATGRVRHAVNIGFDDVGVGSALNARLGVPVRVENDVNAAALGAYLAMSLSGSVGYLNLGTGLAAGLVVDGELWRGSRGVSGEIGHVPVDPGGELCPCGQRGCLETVAAGAAVARHWPTEGAHPAVALFAAADAGDPEAGRVRADLAAGVAAAVRLLVLTTDVDSVVIGGGLSNLGRPLLDDVAGVLDHWAAGSAFLASLELSTRIELLPPGFPVAAVGAATIGARGPATVTAAAV